MFAVSRRVHPGFSVEGQWPAQVAGFGFSGVWVVGGSVRIDRHNGDGIDQPAGRDRAAARGN
jgi:hypothetical protein